AMSKAKFIVFLSLVLLLAIPLLGACSKAAQTTTTTASAKTTSSAVAATTASSTTAAKTLKPLPAILKAVGNSGTATLNTGIPVFNELSKTLGVKITVSDLPNSTDIISALKSKQEDIFVISTTLGRDAAWGLGDFSKPEWGPQPLRNLYSGTSRYWGLFTSKKTGMLTYADVKGKRVTYFPGSSTRNATIEACLKANGLTWDDVKKVNFNAQDDGVQGLIDGVVDVAISGFPSAKVTELDAMSGVVVLPFSRTAESATIFHSLLPHPLVDTKKGTFPGVYQDMLVPASTDFILAYDFFDEDWAYQVTKGIYNSIDAIQKIDIAKGYTKEGAVDFAFPGPFHPGSIKFFKEVGLWTAAVEKTQQDQLKAEQGRLAAWKAQQTTTTK
ncbi:MAG: TAXI family TRAP transporter solute-binding subunit, partial [Dehalococcoidia bacterium]|nr:TAXI family TRAP transporter solute-binding subunit [Dehalococcoidia bacterium]